MPTAHHHDSNGADARRKRQALSLETRAARAVRDAETEDGEGREMWLRVVVDAFKASQMPKLIERAHRMEECSRDWLFYANGSGQGHLHPVSCDDKSCPVCVPHRTRRVRKLIEDRLQADERVRFITLTQPVRPDESAADARARIIRSFSSMWRAQKHAAKKFGKDFENEDEMWRWLAACTADDPAPDDSPFLRGGLRRVEATWSRSGGWHVHLHVLAVGRYVEQADLSAAWQKAGGGSIVDIRGVDHRAAAELTKYVLKVGGLPGERIVEWALAVDGTRDVQTFGSWFNLPLPPDETDGELSELVRPGDVEALAHGITSGPSEAEEAAIARMEHAFGPREGGVRAWRAWGRSVLNGWLAEVQRLEQAGARRESGRAKRAKERGAAQGWLPI